MFSIVYVGLHFSFEKIMRRKKRQKFGKGKKRESYPCNRP
jgi:hypothetical protein